MLYDNRIDVFLTCARTGSFSKAAEELFVTPAGVLKQITAFERDLGLPLFIRTHRGLVLTDGGKQLQAEAEGIQAYCAHAMERVNNAHNGMFGEIRIGTSPLTPPALLADLWPKIQPAISDLSFRLIPFENQENRAKQILANLGDEIDVVAGFFDQTLLDLRACSGLPICSCPIGIGIPFGHRLWQKESVSSQDLQGETVLCIANGWTAATDELRAHLEKECRASLENFDFYTPEVLLKAVNENKLVVAFNIWNGIHPLLRIVGTDWDARITYGFLHSNAPSGAVSRFLAAVQDVSDCDGCAA